jgi:hypothetical protein
MLLFLLAAGSLVWMHLAIRRMERDRIAPALAAQGDELEAGATP